MASLQVAWQMIKLVSSHPRFRIGLLSIGSFVLFRRIFYTLWIRWLTSKTVKSRQTAATARKKTAKHLCKEAEEIDLSNQTAERLVKAIVSGNLTAEDVLNSFTKKALEIDDEINAVVEPVVEAWDQARMLDSLDEKTGLLHGLPISVKESYHIGGYDCTAGLTPFIHKILIEDSVIIKVLKKQGAVPFMRTNIPQLMLSYCSSNPIFGMTLNPHDKTRVPGGSSSGEGALIGGGGSIMGIGSDIGGSIRVPASFCGVYGLKTTSNRLSRKGHIKPLPGILAIKGCVGLIARDIESLILLSKVTMSKDMWTLDPTLPQLPFNQQEFNKKESLCIGYYTYDGNIQCQPPVVRAVMEAKEALERKGHKLVPIDFPTMFKSPYNNGQHFVRIMAGDRGERARELLVNDKLEEGLSTYLRLMKLPRWLWTIISVVASQIDPYLGRIVTGFYGFKSMHEYYNQVDSLMNWQASFLEAWTDNHFDAVICPVFPSPAPKLDRIAKLTMAGAYCMLYNTVDYPAGSVPVTKVTRQDVVRTLDPAVYKPCNFIENLLLQNAHDMEGLPIGVQCVALPYHEEMCLRVMRDIDNEIRNSP